MKPDRRDVNARISSGYRTVNSMLGRSVRRANRVYKNRGWSIALALGACIWTSRPTYGQIEVNAYITNRDSNSVSIVNTKTNTVSSTVTLGIGTGPIGVAVTRRSGVQP
jgi:YVTN family beta-propeller protein